jgi:two-component system sensor histidine kinase AlgZ
MRRKDRAHSMASIRQNPRADGLPDFRNLGVIARILVAVNVLAFAAALAAHPDLASAGQAFVRASALVAPALVASLAVLSFAAPRLARLPYAAGCAAVLALAALLAAGAHAMLGEVAGTGLGRTLAFALASAALILAWLRLRERAFSPALAEARLAALQARIRPHFLFNSLNAVLGLMRRDPRRAEQAIEDLAELFRALMSDGRSFVRLGDEIALLERYAAIEQLRLGERLRLSWELDAAPVDALLPPLVLQPLLENAVYHGVEPAAGPGEVLVRIERRGERVRALIENTLAQPPQGAGRSRRHGSRMALENIRERLALFYDAEARLETAAAGGRYRVEIDLPYRSGAS